MQFIVILIALVLVGLLVQKQFSTPDPKIEAVKQEVGVDVPTVPSRPQDMQQFNHDVNQMLQDQAAEQQEKLKALGE